MKIHETFAYCDLYISETGARCVHISKSKGEKSLVILSGVFVIVASPVITVRENDPFIKLVKVCESESDAYQKWIRTIGKLVVKDYKSKYFDNPNMEDHLTNGNCPEELRDTALGITKTVLATLKDSLT